MHNLAFSFQDTWDSMIEFYQKLGIFGGFFLAMFENFFPPLPIFAIVTANVSSFGIIIGFLISVLGHIVGGVIVFYLVRIFIKPRIDRRAKKDSKLIKFEKWISRRSFGFLLVILSQPFFPYSIIISAGGISNISKRKFVTALIIGNFFMTLFLTMIGHNVNKIIVEKDITSAVLTVSLLTFAFLLGKFIEIKVKKHEEKEGEIEIWKK